MERLLVMRLHCTGVQAEASLNGVPLLRCGPSGSALALPVHEFALAGANTLELVIQPPPPGQPPQPQPWLSNGQCGASLRLLLPRIGQAAHPEFARTLAQIDWAPADGEVVEVPATLQQRVELPIGFPRWRWLDTPVVDDPRALAPQAAALLQRIVLGLARGNADPLISAARLQLEELALAYQRPLADDVGRLRQQVQHWHAQAPLQPPMPLAESLVLRPVAGGRLLDCLTASGEPALHCPRPDGGVLRWRTRLACIDNQLYVLR